MSDKVTKLVTDISKMSPVAQDVVKAVVQASITDNAPERFDSETLDATQNLIVRLSQQLEELSDKQKDIRDMIKSVFDNDQELQQAEQIVQEQMKAAKKRKQEINISSQVVDLKMKSADLGEDIKMVRESLNTHLLNYFQLTGSQTVDFPGGEEREMIIRAKIKGNSNRQRNTSKPVLGQRDIFGGEVKDENK